MGLTEVAYKLLEKEYNKCKDGVHIPSSLHMQTRVIARTLEILRVSWVKVSPCTPNV